MYGFFKRSTSRVFNQQKILVLISSTPKTPRRFYSSIPSSTTSQIEEHEFRRNEALKKYGLSHLKLIWPKSTGHLEKVDYIQRNPQSIRQMYGEADLSKLPIFQGGFINFGYWPKPFFDNKEITIEQRIGCSKDMYKIIGNLAGVSKKHSLLDVGCGLGYGSTFFSQHYSPKLVVGVDISPDQIARAKKHQASSIASGKLRFTIGEAESLPFTDNSFDCVLSVEAAQHFSSIDDFSKEVSRILKPNGKLVMTSFFPKNKEGIDALNRIVPDYQIHGSQVTVDEIAKVLSQQLKNVEVTSIGENVWDGFSKWLDQIGYHDQWSKIWPALYDRGLIDYVVYL